MGVCATGKSTLGRALADAAEAPFIDADDFHPRANIEKMGAGVPLTDEDRWGWLDAVGRAAAHEVGQYGCVVVACSALKAAYRARLAACVRGVRVVVVHLTAERAEIDRRLRERHEAGTHFMPPSLLESQLSTLEPPAEGEPGVDAVVTVRAFTSLPVQLDAAKARLVMGGEA